MKRYPPIKPLEYIFFSQKSIVFIFILPDLDAIKIIKVKS